MADEVELQKLIVRLTGDASGYQKMITDAQKSAEGLAKGIDGATKTIQSDFGKIASAGNVINDVFLKTFGVQVPAAAGDTVKAVELMTKSMEKAEDVAQTLSDGLSAISTAGTITAIGLGVIALGGFTYWLGKTTGVLDDYDAAQKRVEESTKKFTKATEEETQEILERAKKLEQVDKRLKLTGDKSERDTFLEQELDVVNEKIKEVEESAERLANARGKVDVFFSKIPGWDLLSSLLRRGGGFEEANRLEGVLGALNEQAAKFQEAMSDENAAKQLRKLKYEAEDLAREMKKAMDTAGLNEFQKKIQSLKDRGLPLENIYGKGGLISTQAVAETENTLNKISEKRRQIHLEVTGMDEIERQLLELQRKATGVTAEQLKKVEEALRALKLEEAERDVYNLNKSLEKQAATIGMTANEARLYELSLKKVTAEQLANTRALMEFVEIAQQRLKLNEALRETLGHLHQSVILFGESADAIKLYTLSLAGASDEQLKTVERLQLLHKGLQVTKDVLTPAETAGMRIAELDKLLKEGVISQEVYSRAVDKVTKSLHGQRESIQGVQAALVNSLEGRARLQAWIDKQRDINTITPDKNPAILLQQQVKVAQEEVERLKNALEKVATSDPLGRMGRQAKELANQLAAARKILEDLGGKELGGRPGQVAAKPPAEEVIEKLKPPQALNAAQQALNDLEKQIKELETQWQSLIKFGGDAGEIKSLESVLARLIQQWGELNKRIQETNPDAIAGKMKDLNDRIKELQGQRDSLAKFGDATTEGELKSLETLIAKLIKERDELKKLGEASGVKLLSNEFTQMLGTPNDVLGKFGELVPGEWGNALKEVVEVVKEVDKAGPIEVKVSDQQTAAKVQEDLEDVAKEVKVLDGSTATVKVVADIDNLLGDLGVNELQAAGGIELPVTANLNGVVTALEQLGATPIPLAFTASLDDVVAQLHELDNTLVEVKVNANLDEVQAVLDQLGTTTIPVIFTANLDAVQDDLSNLITSIPLTFTTNLAEVTTQLQTLEQVLPKVEITANTDEVQAQLDNLTTAIALTFTDNLTTVQADLDNLATTLPLTFTSNLDDVVTQLQSLDTVVVEIGVTANTDEVVRLLEGITLPDLYVSVTTDLTAVQTELDSLATTIPITFTTNLDDIETQLTNLTVKLALPVETTTAAGIGQGDGGIGVKLSPAVQSVEPTNGLPPKQPTSDPEIKQLLGQMLDVLRTIADQPVVEFVQDDGESL